MKQKRNREFQQIMKAIREPEIARISCSIDGIDGIDGIDNADDLRIESRKAGWFIITANKTVGPFKYLTEFNDAKQKELAKELAVDHRLLWKAVMRISMSLEETKPLSIPQQIQLQRKIVTANLSEEVKRIHPAIDYERDSKRAHVGVWIPCKITYQKKRDEEEARTTERDLMFLVTSNRELILADDEKLREYKLRLGYRPLPGYNRWNLADVTAYLEGKATVVPSDVYRTVKQALQFYLDFPDPRFYDYIALWIVGTYFAPLFKAYPYLYIGGVKRVGKTKFLMIIFCLAFNAVFSANITTSSLFRIIQDLRAALLIDETEKLYQSDRLVDFRSILLSGYKKGLPAHRTEGEEGKRKQPTSFEVYGPKAIANIHGLEDVLEDRCIPVIMLRSLNPEIKNREPDITDPKWATMRNQLYLLWLNYAGEVSVGCVGSEGSEGFLNEVGLESRDLELWTAPLILARFFEDHGITGLFKSMVELAGDVSKQKFIENLTESADMVLTQILQGIIDKDDYYSVTTIKKTMIEAYGEEDPPKWLTNEWVGRALRRLGFKDKRRMGTGNQYRLTLEGVKNAALRLGITTIEPPQNGTQPTQHAQHTLASPERLEPEPTGLLKYPLKAEKKADKKEAEKQ